ncbi:MAG: hypothetical protein C4527_19930 [Candidatus Omnitrophota bacterium]|jgi:hypothetical protein|nr:MAG: hypothetical protein C4527_19930 [Candidatus Omnitrophota bacterium]
MSLIYRKTSYRYLTPNRYPSPNEAKKESQRAKPLEAETHLDPNPDQYLSPNGAKEDSRRATPLEKEAQIDPSPERAKEANVAYVFLRPFRATFNFKHQTRAVGPGYRLSPRWGFDT